LKNNNNNKDLSGITTIDLCKCVAFLEFEISNAMSLNKMCLTINIYNLLRRSYILFSLL